MGKVYSKIKGGSEATPVTLQGQNLLSIADLTPESLREIIILSLRIKKSFAEDEKGARKSKPLQGLSLSMLLDQPSVTTRVSLETAVSRLGGHPIFLSKSDLSPAEDEKMKDTAMVLSRYNHLLFASVHAHATLELLCEHTSVPVVNAQSDMSHPLQALALITTLAERFGETLPGRTLAWLGDGSNLQLDLISACAMLGVNVRVARAEGRAPQVEELERAAQVAAQRGANVQVGNCALTAVRGVDVVVTDRGVTEGEQPGGNEYQVTAEMMAAAAEGAVFLHGTPCGRGEEVSEEVYYSPHSLVLQAAENHMWVCMAVCMALLGLPWEED